MGMSQSIIQQICTICSVLLLSNTNNVQAFQNNPAYSNVARPLLSFHQITTQLSIATDSRVSASDFKSDGHLSDESAKRLAQERANFAASRRKSGRRPAGTTTTTIQKTGIGGHNKNNHGHNTASNNNLKKKNKNNSHSKKKKKSSKPVDKRQLVARCWEELATIKDGLVHSRGHGNIHSSLISRLAAVSHNAFILGGRHQDAQEVGMEALHLQFSLEHDVEASTVVSAIRSLCKTPTLKTRSSNSKNFSLENQQQERSIAHLETGPNINENSKSKDITHAMLAFRLLKRLVSGHGIVIHEDDPHGDTIPMEEKDVCAIMNALVRVNEMDQAYKLLRLQEERSDCLPEVTAVGYSILIKGYAYNVNTVSSDSSSENFNDAFSTLTQIETLLSRAHEHRIEPDVIFLNSVIDAYITLDAHDRAEIVFESMRRNDAEHLRPNTRTYNTMLKGKAKLGYVREALHLSAEMERLGKHDAVSVNTLVKTMVRAGEFDMAEAVLEEYTNRGMEQDASSASRKKTQKFQRHPNVEAYTELLDGYAKADMIKQAFATFDKMVEKGVTPNEITYTCMVHALGMAFKTKEARVILDQQRKILLQHKNYNSVNAEKDCVVMFNAYLSGLLHTCTCEDCEYDSCTNFDINRRVNEALSVVNGMMMTSASTSTDTHSPRLLSGHRHDNTSKGAGHHESINNSTLRCKPNAVTAITLIDGLAKCRDPAPRIIVDELGRKLVDSISSELDTHDVVKVQTALLQAFTIASSLPSKAPTSRSTQYHQTYSNDQLFAMVQQVYTSIESTGRGADIIALNAYLDACCRYRRFRRAFEEFDHAIKLMDSHDPHSKGKTTTPKGHRVPYSSFHRQQVNVATYTILISALLSNYYGRVTPVTVSTRVQGLYKDMRKRGIFPDAGLVDFILNSMTNNSPRDNDQHHHGCGSALPSFMEHDSKIRVQDGKFMLSILNDAKNFSLYDSSKDFRKRRRLVERALGREEESAGDELLRRKGWNKVESGFRFLGGGSSSSSTHENQHYVGQNQKDKQPDEFLESKGWNDVDSGFRFW